MDLKEAKKLINYARSAGIKTFKLGDLEVDFRQEITIEPRKRLKSVPKADEVKLPPPDAPPTLDQINQYIYGDGEAG